LYKIPPGTLFLGKNLRILPECPSTNTLAAELSQSGQAPEGTVIITHHQTAGRGQRGNTWQSGKGLNLTLSVVLHPVFLTAIQQFQLNKAIALAVREAVQPYVKEEVKVKWPNDILIVDRKVCGILIENQLTGDKISRSIVGIGLNVNQEEFDSHMAGSVSISAGNRIDLAKLFEELMSQIESRYLKLRSKEPGARSKELDGDYLQALYRLNERHRFIVNEAEVDGVIRNVDENGKLVVEIENTLRSFDLKEIKYVY
jgi:BirA family biotin operon repressor/biotin-[acetyl-CoA-carboxylase] ligase